MLAIVSLGGFIALSFAAASMTRLASGTGVAKGLAAPPLAAVGSGGAAFLDGPLDSEAVSAGVRQAQELSARGDELALTEASRACHAQLRRAPGLALLDRCAAFDDAVVLLQDRDPLRDRGPFSELAVTGRQMSSATLLSGDYLEIDSRLDRIRLKVELALAPSELPTAPPGEHAGAGF